MTNKKYNITSAVFFLLSIFMIVMIFVSTYIIARTNDMYYEIRFFESLSAKNVIYMISFLMIIVLLFAKQYIAVAIFSFIAGGILLYGGIEGFTDYSKIRYSIPDISDGTISIKFIFNSILLYPTLIGLAFIFMGVSIILSTQKQKNTAFSPITKLIAIAGIVPFTYCIVRFLIEIFKNSQSLSDDVLLIVICFCIIFSLIFMASGICSGSNCFKFIARTRNNYTPYTELDLSNPYAPAGTSTRKSDSGNSTFGAGGTVGGPTFYQPYADSTDNSDSSFDTYGNSTAAENISGSKAKETYENSNAVVNEVNFTATESTYVEHEFGTPGNSKQTEVLQDNEETEPPVSKIIIDDGTRFDDKKTDGFSVADEIQKFRTLADNGIISEVEFEEKKKQLLNS